MKRPFVWQGSPTPVGITRSVDLPADERFKDMSIQTLESADKKLQVIGIFQETHRFGKDTEEIIHRVHIVSADQFRIVKELLNQISESKISKDHPLFLQIRAQYEQLRVVEPSYPLLKEADYKDIPEFCP